MRRSKEFFTLNRFYINVNTASIYSFLHDQDPIAVQYFITLIVHKKILRSVFVRHHLRHVVKIETCALQFQFGDFRLAVGIIFCQDSVIFAESVVHIPHIVGRVFILFVVEGVSAGIGAEFLVGSSDDFVATFRAGLGFHWCVFLVNIFNFLNVSFR